MKIRIITSLLVFAILIATNFVPLDVYAKDRRCPLNDYDKPYVVIKSNMNPRICFTRLSKDELRNVTDAEVRIMIMAAKRNNHVETGWGETRTEYFKISDGTYKKKLLRDGIFPAGMFKKFTKDDYWGDITPEPITYKIHVMISVTHSKKKMPNMVNQLVFMKDDDINIHPDFGPCSDHWNVTVKNNSKQKCE